MTVTMKVGKSYVDRTGYLWLCDGIRDRFFVACAPGGLQRGRFTLEGLFVPAHSIDRLVDEHPNDLVEEVGAVMARGVQTASIQEALDQAKEQQAAEPASKFDGGKPRLDLLAPEFLTGTADILAFGANKYGARNWELGMSWSRPFGAMMRHMWAWWSGQALDDETGKSHLWHAACCLMFLIAYEERKKGTDDRPKQD